MTTSLASQLAGLAAQQASRQEGATSLRVRESYLFTPRAAAEQDFVTVHALGVTGWEQLVNEDASLGAWRHADLLFGEESVHLDRGTVPASENKTIDEASEELLYLLGPVLLSRSAAKVIEWMVRRFALHRHVPVALVRAFLPFHTTPQFARILQLVPLDRVPSLHFLQAAKKAQTPLPTSVLVQAMGNLDVLRLVAQTRTPLPGVHRFPVTFWTATLVQFCLHAKRRKRAGDAQAVLAILLPDAMRLLQAPVDTEAAVGALMVLCSISTAYALSANAVRGLLEGVARLADTPSPTLARAMVACCFALCASPEDAGEAFASEPRLLSDATLRGLLQLPELGAQVLRALREHDVRRFVAQLLAALSDHLDQDDARALLEVLLDAELPEGLVQSTCERLITSDKTWVPKIEVLATLRQRRPAALDAALDRVRAANEGKAWAVLSAVLHHHATGSVPQQSATDSTALWLGVQSGDATQRLLTLQELFAAVRRGAVRAEDTLVADAVHAALAEPTLPILEAMYAEDELLRAALAPDALLSAIVARLAHEVAPKEYKLHVRFCVALGDTTPALAARVWEAVVWPFLLPSPHAKMAAAAVDAVRGATGALAPYARVLRDVPPPSECVPYVAGLVAGLLEVLASAPAAEQERLAAFYLSAAEAPVSRGGALALLVLAQALAHKSLGALWHSVAFLSAALVRRHQLLAGDADILLSESVEAVLPPVLHGLSRRSVRLLGLQLMYAIVQRMPVPGDASLFIAVQQRAAPDAQLIWHVFQTLHAPGVGHVASETLAPVLYARLGQEALALLAGIWSMESAPGKDVGTLRAALDAQTSVYVPGSDVAERLLAVRHATALVRHATHKKTPLDLQTLLPSLFLLLQEPVPVLRDAGAQLLVALAALNAAAPLPAPIYGYEAVYGAEASAPLQYLDGDSYMQYVSALAADASTYVNDPDSLAAAHAVALAGSKKDQVVLRNRVLCYVLSHAVCWDSLHARTALLRAVHRVAAPCKLQTLLPLVEASVAAPLPAEPRRDTYLDLLFACYEGGSIERSSWAAFLQALQSDAPSGLQTAALHALDRIFLALTPELREEAFLALATTLANPKIRGTPEAAAALRTLPVSDGVLVAVLRTLLASLGEVDEERSRKRARSDDEAVRGAAVVLITVLESVQSRTLGMSAALVAALFDVVRAGIALHTTVLFNAEYVLQLAMQSLCAMFDHVTSLPADVAQVVRADTIVSAIKISSNTQSINHAILLLTRFARLDAELVLHNIMPIFTFVGLSVLQRDDRFTLSVVEQTLRSIIPAFVNAVRPQVVNAQDARLALWLETRSLLRIFSDAASHIPRHRRQVFFRLLVDVLGAPDFLAPVAMLLADRAAHRVGKSVGSAASLLQLPLGVLRSEPSDVRLHAIDQIWPEIQRLYQGHAAFLEVTPKREYSEEHLSPAKQALTLLALIEHALPSQAADAEPCVWHALCTLPADGPGREALARVLKASVRLLSDASFLRIVCMLLRAQRTPPPGCNGAVPGAVPDAEMQATGLALLAARPVSDEAVHRALLDVWAAAPASDLGKDALAALHASIAQGASPDLLPPLLTACDSPQVLRVLGDLVGHLGVKALAHLTTLVHAAADAAQRSDAAHVAAGLALLASLFRALPQFMHAYVEKAVRVLSDGSVHALIKSRASGVRAAHRILQDVVVKRMPFGTLLDALNGVWAESYEPAHLLTLLQLGVKGMDKAAVQQHYKAVFRFLLRAFALQEKRGVDASIATAPERAIGVYIALALKLSESQFRTLFLRTYDWAAVDLLEEGEPEQGAVYARALVLYTLLTRLLDELKGMVSAYFAVVYDHVLRLLDQSAADETCATPLWYAVVHSVTACADADEGTFWNASRAARLVKPLLAQLPAIGAEDAKATNAVAKAALAVAETVPDDVYLRALNTEVMKHAGSASLAVRVHALHVAASVWAAHGVNLLAFVPETVAQLSELLDDVDPRAASAALKLRREIEAALGEPLDSYLE